MHKRIFLIFSIIALFIIGFVAAFTVFSAANKAVVLTAADVPPAPQAEKRPVAENTTVSIEDTTAAAQDELAAAPSGQPVEWVIPEGETIASRISTPAGFERIDYAEGSFGAFVRSYKLKADGTAVLYYDGREKNSDNHIAVFDMFLADRDLQQCADSIMRIIAEYYYAEQQYDKISFDFVSGFECRYDKWIEGYRVGFDGNDAFWKEGGTKGASAGTFESYINTVFAYASTISLEADSEQTEIEELQVGDIFIKAGSPGHVVMVADICENEMGEKAFLLAQGYMPAQSFHLLKNPASDEDPWYYESEFAYPFQTPEYTFPEGSLKRLSVLEQALPMQ